MNALSPEDSPFDRLPLHASYYQDVASKLLPPESRRYTIAVVALPSFRCEWALQLHGTERSGYTLSVSQVDKPLRENQSDEVSISQHHLGVTHSFANALAGVVNKALLTVTNTTRQPNGRDGVKYHFLAQHPEFHRICGQTWSPEPPTMAGKLVDLIERLRRRVQGDSSAECSVDTIAGELQRFEIPPPFRPNEKQIKALVKETSEFVTQMSDATLLKCSEFGNEIINKMK